MSFQLGDVERWAGLVVKNIGHPLNEQATKQAIVLPLLNVLGFPIHDPLTVRPEYPGPQTSGGPTFIDYVINVDGTPRIAIECKSLGTQLERHREQLRTYYGSNPDFRLAILTNGVQIEFFSDTLETNYMDSAPFLTMDARSIEKRGLNTSQAELLNILTRRPVAWDAVRRLASAELLRRRVADWLAAEVRQPSFEFCRFVLRQNGESHVRETRLPEYSSLIREAFLDGLVLPLYQKVRDEFSKQSEPVVGSSQPEISDRNSRIVTTDREMEVFELSRRAVAKRMVMVPDFSIDDLKFEDQITKFSVFYKRKNLGRLFDFYERDDCYGRFVFQNDTAIDARQFSDVMRSICEAAERAFALTSAR